MDPTPGRRPGPHPADPARRVLAGAGAVLLALAVAACGGGGPAPSAEPGPESSAAADPRDRPTDPCGLIDLVMQDHVDLRLIRLRPANRDILELTVQTMRIDWDDTRGDLPDELSEESRAVSRALTELEIAMLGYITSPDPIAAAEQVLEAEIVFDRALLALRDRSTCPPFVPEVVVTPSPEPTPTPPPVPDPTPFPSLPARPERSAAP